MAQALSRPPGDAPVAPGIAILPWGNAIEDFLDPIGLDLDAFCTRMTGGWLFGYADALRIAGWRPFLVCFSRAVSAPSRREHTPSGMPICVLPRRLPTWIPWRIAPYLATPPLALARALRREGCAAILVQEYESPRFDVVAALGRLMRLPVYATFQGSDGHPPGPVEDALRPRALRSARGFAIANREEAERVVRRYGVAPARIARVQNPVDLGLWRPGERAAARVALGLPADARVAICHGRIEIRRKGLDVLLDAWAKVVAARPGRELQLLLVGSGADDEALRARLADRTLASVRWLAGYELDREVMRRNLSAADVYAIASRVEGLPVAPLEAMACGLPVAASDIPPLRNILEHGLASGEITTPVGDADALADALGRFLDDPGLALATGCNARATVETRFSVEAVARQLGAMLKAE